MQSTYKLVFTLTAHIYAMESAGKITNDQTKELINLILTITKLEDYMAYAKLVHMLDKAGKIELNIK